MPAVAWQQFFSTISEKLFIADKVDGSLVVTVLLSRLVMSWKSRKPLIVKPVMEAVLPPSQMVFLSFFWAGWQCLAGAWRLLGGEHWCFWRPRCPSSQANLSIFAPFKQKIGSHHVLPHRKIDKFIIILNQMFGRHWKCLSSQASLYWPSPTSSSTTSSTRYSINFDLTSFDFWYLHSKWW